MPAAYCDSLACFLASRLLQPATCAAGLSVFEAGDPMAFNMLQFSSSCYQSSHSINAIDPACCSFGVSNQ
jgi:hypothetical protein